MNGGGDEDAGIKSGIKAENGERAPCGPPGIPFREDDFNFIQGTPTEEGIRLDRCHSLFTDDRSNEFYTWEDFKILGP